MLNRRWCCDIVAPSTDTQTFKTEPLSCSCHSLAPCPLVVIFHQSTRCPQIWTVSKKADCIFKRPSGILYKFPLLVSLSLFSFRSVFPQLILVSVIKRVFGFLFITDKRAWSVACVSELYSCVFLDGLCQLIVFYGYLVLCCSGFFFLCLSSTFPTTQKLQLRDGEPDCDGKMTDIVSIEDTLLFLCYFK